MPPLTFLLMQLMAAYTVLVEPFLRTNFYRNLKRRLSTDPGARILFYRTQTLWELSWVVVLAVIAFSLPQPMRLFGLTIPNQVGWIILGALLLGIGLSTVLLRRNSGAMEAMRRSLETSTVLLPSTEAERTWYTIAAVTAGICEELLYRGFLMLYLKANFPTVDWLFAAIISGIVYGFSRAYQGWRGITQTALMGFSFAIIYVLSGSLIPAMVFHILAELRNLIVWQPEATAKKHK